MNMTVKERRARSRVLVDEVLKAYPDKMAKRRAKHLGQHEQGGPDDLRLVSRAIGTELAART